jgi:heme exporter protein CcmD
MDLNAPHVDFVIAAYALAIIALAGLVFAVARAYKKARNETKI